MLSTCRLLKQHDRCAYCLHLHLHFVELFFRLEQQWWLQRLFTWLGSSLCLNLLNTNLTEFPFLNRNSLLVAIPISAMQAECNKSPTLPSTYSSSIAWRAVCESASASTLAIRCTDSDLYINWASSTWLAPILQQQLCQNFRWKQKVKNSTNFCGFHCAHKSSFRNLHF